MITIFDANYLAISFLITFVVSVCWRLLGFTFASSLSLVIVSIRISVGFGCLLRVWTQIQMACYVIAAGCKFDKITG